MKTEVKTMVKTVVKTKTNVNYVFSAAGEKRKQTPEQRCERPWLLHVNLSFHLGFPFGFHLDFPAVFPPWALRF